MTALPYEASAFDAVICLWSAFYELLEPDEQIAALREMQRVLQPGGVAIVEGPEFVPATNEDRRSGARSGPDGRLVDSIVDGERMRQFAHDPTPPCSTWRQLPGSTRRTSRSSAGPAATGRS